MRSSSASCARLKCPHMHRKFIARTCGLLTHSLLHAARAQRFNCTQVHSSNKSSVRLLASDSNAVLLCAPAPRAHARNLWRFRRCDFNEHHRTAHRAEREPRKRPGGGQLCGERVRNELCTLLQTTTVDGGVLQSQISTRRRAAF